MLNFVSFSWFWRNFTKNLGKYNSILLYVHCIKHQTLFYACTNISCCINPKMLIFIKTILLSILNSVYWIYSFTKIPKSNLICRNILIAFTYIWIIYSRSFLFKQCIFLIETFRNRHNDSENVLLENIFGCITTYRPSLPFSIIKRTKLDNINIL